MKKINKKDKQKSQKRREFVVHLIFSFLPKNWVIKTHNKTESIESFLYGYLEHKFFNQNFEKTVMDLYYFLEELKKNFDKSPTDSFEDLLLFLDQKFSKKRKIKSKFKYFVKWILPILSFLVGVAGLIFK